MEKKYRIDLEVVGSCATTLDNIDNWSPKGIKSYLEDLLDNDASLKEQNIRLIVASRKDNITVYSVTPDELNPQNQEPVEVKLVKKYYVNGFYVECDSKRRLEIEKERNHRGYNYRCFAICDTKEEADVIAEQHNLGDYTEKGHCGTIYCYSEAWVEEEEEEA